jgi:hypothetical protein
MICADTDSITERHPFYKEWCIQDHSFELDAGFGYPQALDIDWRPSITLGRQVKGRKEWSTTLHLGLIGNKRSHY